MKKLLAALLALALCASAYAQVSTASLLSARTTTGGCTAVTISSAAPVRVFHVNGTTSAGSGAAEVEIRAGLTASNVSVVLGTVTLTLSTSATAAAGNGGIASNANWPYVCANVNSISGTNASVNATVGVN